MEPLMSDFSRSITSTGLDAMEETHRAQPMQTITVPCTFMADGETASTPGALILHVDADELDLNSTSIFIIYLMEIFKKELCGLSELKNRTIYDQIDQNFFESEID
jgi:hypothetical protein